MNSFARSHRQLLLVVALGLGLNLLSLLWPVGVPQGGRWPNQFSITGRGVQASGVDLFFDFGDGIHADQISHQEMDGSNQPRELKFPLPVGMLYGLRFDPSSFDKVSTWENARILSEDGRVLHQFAPADFAISQQVESLVVAGETLQVVPTKGAFDSTLMLKLRHPLRLPDDSAAGLRIQAPFFLAQRIIALLLGLAGVGIALLVLRRGHASGGETPAAPTRGLEIVALLFVALSLVFFRRPSLFLAPQMFVEDAGVFFQSHHLIGWKSLLVPYSGYLHLIPRTTAGVAAWFPVAWAPWIFEAVALLFILATVLKAASPRVGLPFAYACALAALCVPNSEEVMAFLTNVHWWGGLILLLMAVSAPARTRGELARDLLAVVLVGLSGPWAVLFAPLFLYRVWRQRTPGSIATVALLLVAGGVQWHFNVRDPHLFEKGYWANHMLPALAGMGYRTGGQLVNYLPNNVGSAPLPWEIGALLGWLLLLVGLPVAKPHRWIRFAFIFTALTVVTATVLRTYSWEYMLFSTAICQRYIFLPLLLTFWLLIMTLDNPGWRRGLALVLLAVIALRNLDSFRMLPVTDFHWEKYARQVEQGQTVTVPIYPAGWSVKFDVRPTP